MNEHSSVAPERPTWRYAAGGAIYIAAATALSMLAAIREFVNGTIPLWVAPLALGVAGTLGVSGGLTYALVGRRLRTRGKLGAYAAGIVTVAGYMLPFELAVAVFWNQAPADLSPIHAIAAALLATVFLGLVAGYGLARGTDAGGQHVETE